MRTMKILCILFLLNINAYGDIKITIDELETLIKIGVLDKFQFMAKSDTGFTGEHVYEEDGTAGDWEGSGWGVSYLVDSFQAKVKSRKLIHSDQVIMDTATYAHCSCYGASDNASWESGEPVNELNIVKHLSDIDPVLKNEKIGLQYSQAVFFRTTLIEDLKSTSSDIYVSNENQYLLEFIRSGTIASLPTITAREILSYAPFEIKGIEQQLPLIKKEFEEHYIKQQHSVQPEC